MSMVVQHNLQAMNSNRMLGITTSSQSKSTEKLSSGYKINRAADDAAGLTISEKMRKQMRGLDRASTNAQDGVSAVQTAEGALTEVHSMLQRMNELAVQSANGTNSKSDRDAIQAEIDQLHTEIDRVAETTKFNEIYLLKGDETGTTKDVYSYKSSVPVEASFDFGATTTLYDAAGNSYTKGNDEATALAVLEAGGKLYSADPTTNVATAGTDYTAATVALKAGVNLFIPGTTTAITASSTPPLSDYFEAAADGSVSLAAGKTLADVSTGPNASTAPSAVEDVVEGTAAKLNAGTDLYDKDGNKITDDAGLITALMAGEDVYTQAPAVADDYTYTPAGTQRGQLYDDAGQEVAASDITQEMIDGGKLFADKDQKTAITAANISTYTDKATANADLSFNLHVGADSTTNNKIGVTIAHMSAAGIGLGAKLDVSSEDSATAAIDIVSAAIQTVSKQRSDLGAIQNRLEHTIANLDNIVENTTAAESRIRDTDMAEEMVEYSKNNILAQAGQSMLAQANQSTQGVLSLLG